MQLTAFRVGAAAWMFMGVVHDILELVLPGDPELTAALRASSLEVGPFSLDADLLSRGVSLSMGLAMVVAGVLLWMIAGAFRTEPGRARPFGIVAVVGTVLTLGLAVVWVPGPPLATFTVAAVAFVVALTGKASAPHRPRMTAPTSWSASRMSSGTVQRPEPSRIAFSKRTRLLGLLLESPHLDPRLQGRGALLGPAERGLLVGDVDDPEPADVLGGLDERPRNALRLVARGVDGDRRRRRMESTSGDQRP